MTVSPAGSTPAAAVTHGGDGQGRAGLQGMAQGPFGNFSRIMLLEAVWVRQEVNTILFPKDLISFVAKVALGLGSSVP